MIIKEASRIDVKNICELFNESVLAVSNELYSADEKKSWSEAAKNEEHWANVIQDQYFLVIYINGDLKGFASVKKECGELDYLYVNKDYQRKKVATMLLHELELFSKNNEITKLQATVSLAALPFFRTNGFEILEETTNKSRGGLMLAVNRMQKEL